MLLNAATSVYSEETAQAGNEHEWVRFLLKSKISMLAAGNSPATYLQILEKKRDCDIKHKKLVGGAAVTRLLGMGKQISFTVVNVLNA